MANVLLINPPITRKDGNLWGSVMGVLPPQALAIIGALLEKEGHQVRIFDAVAEKVHLEDAKEKLLLEYVEFSPDFIGITITTMLANFGYDISKDCKDIWPECKIIAGGVHPTAEPNDVIAHKEIDYVVRDEGEFTFLDIIGGKEVSGILGLTYREGEQIVHNQKRPWIQKMDDLPLPAYHLLPMKKYKPSTGTYKRLPAVSMVISRGCPGKCTFCYQPYGALLRMRSASKIFEEVKLLVEKYGMRDICFYDDNFCTYQDNVKKFCDLMIQYNLENDRKIYWSCFSRVDWIEEDTVKKMKEAGCHRIMFGVESANKKVLENIKKNIDIDQVLKTHKIIRNYGIDTHATFMFGNPGETKETMQQTIDFALTLDPDIAQFNILAPNPGTEVYKWARENGYLKKVQWKDYDLYTPVLELPTVDSATLQKYYKMAFKKFYYRPKYLFRRVFRLFKDPYEIKNALSGLKALINVSSN